MSPLRATGRQTGTAGLPAPLMALVAALLLAVASACSPAKPTDSPEDREPLAVVDLMGGPAEGFARALEPRTFSFPEDHGPHPRFRTEWWYFVGNLETVEGESAAGRRFGYQLTFFRSSVAAEPVERSSEWATHQLFMAHLALTDPAGGRFHAHERFSRGAMGLAGARGEPLAVWLEDWRMERPAAAGTGGRETFTLRAREAELALELTLDSLKPTVLQGERGLSQKGSAPGNASYYYSLTRLATRGTVTLDGTSYEVAGLSWLDREWSTSSLEPTLAGWDWMALQLDDGSDLMVYQLRERDGGAHPASSGSLVAPDGTSRTLAVTDFDLEPLEWWTSGSTGATYPIRWRVEVRAGPADGGRDTGGLELEVESLLPDQEHRGTFRYWEGAVIASGRDAAGPLAGRGYVELTGYADSDRPAEPD